MKALNFNNHKIQLFILPCSLALDMLGREWNTCRAHILGTCVKTTTGHVHNSGRFHRITQVLEFTEQLKKLRFADNLAVRFSYFKNKRLERKRKLRSVVSCVEENTTVNRARVAGIMSRYDAMSRCSV